MIHIKKSIDKQFYVTVVGENGECLSTSEMLTSKQKAWKNIEAQWNEFGAVVLLEITDDTFKKPKIVQVQVPR